jgi:hypothetical protein
MNIFFVLFQNLLICCLFNVFDRSLSILRRSLYPPSLHVFDIMVLGRFHQKHPWERSFGFLETADTIACVPPFLEKVNE